MRQVGMRATCPEPVPLPSLISFDQSKEFLGYITSSLDMNGC